MMVSSEKSGKASSGKRTASKSGTAVAPTKPPKKPDIAGKPPAVVKAAAKPAVDKPARSPRKKKPVLVPLAQRNYYVEVAAYHIAERRGFAPGDPLDDWIQAEAEIDRLLAAGLLGS